MLKPDTARWGQTAADLMLLAITSTHQRTRERYHALHAIAERKISATKVALTLNRNPRTVMEWVRTYNEGGPQSLVYRKTGGRSRSFAKKTSQD